MYIIYERERKSAGRDYNVCVRAHVCVCACPPSFLNERTAVQSLGWPPVEVEYFINDVICLFFLQSGQHSVSAGTEVSLSVALSGMCCACVSPKQLWCRQFSFFARVRRVYLLMKCLVTPHPTPPSVLAEAGCCSARVLRVGIAFSESCAASLSV